MGSNFLGDLSLGNEKSSSKNNSSRKGKKGSSDRPKQPQRGLGVAQLEKIRLHSQLGSSTYLPPSTHHLTFPFNLSQEDIRPSLSYSSSSSYSSSFGFPVEQQSFMMGLSETGNSSYPPDYLQQHTPQSRWNHGNAILESPYLRQPSITTRHFLNQQEEDLLGNRRNQDKVDSMGTSSPHSGSNGNQELDLELRLSL